MPVMMFVWIALIAFFAIIEGLTAQLVSVWFVIGSVAALGSYFFNANQWIQVAVFVVVSAVALAVTRPLVKKFITNKIVPTNADSYIGQEAVVTETINNLHAKGTVKVRGNLWTARSSNDAEILEGSIVIVEKIEGVKLIVSQK